MSNDFEKAIKILNEGEVSLAAVRDGEVFTDIGIGVKPVVGKMKENLRFFEGYSIADKVIGKAAALLFVLSGASYVYGKIMSEHAIKILEENNISFSYGELVPFIENRTNDDMCPLEKSVMSTDSPTEGYNNIIKKIEELMKNK